MNLSAGFHVRAGFLVVEEWEVWGGMLKAATQQLVSQSNATAEGETSGHSRRGRDPEVVQIEPTMLVI